MNWKFGSYLVTMAALVGSAAMAQAASTKATEEAHRGARMLREIRADAAHVRTAASRLDELTQGSNAAWLAYDRQWNEIKPYTEDMQLKLWGLEDMRASLSGPEQKELDQAKPVIQAILNRTHELRELLDKPGVETTNSHFKTYATSLRIDARKLDREISAS